MPTKIKSLRFAFDSLWDLLLVTEHEIIPHEGREYMFKRTIMYVPMAENLAKIRTI
jgi:hypothetical protein